MDECDWYEFSENENLALQSTNIFIVTSKEKTKLLAVNESTIKLIGSLELNRTTRSTDCDIIQMLKSFKMNLMPILILIVLLQFDIFNFFSFLLEHQQKTG